MAADDRLRQCGSGGIPHPTDADRLPRRVASLSSTADYRRARQMVTSQNQGVSQPASTISVNISQKLRPFRSGESLDKELKNRLDKLHLDANRNSRTVTELGNIILRKLKESYPRSFSWDKLNSGSYYDKTKVWHC